MFDCIAKVSKQEGYSALYKGIKPALLRQASYSSIRMGIYEPIRDLISRGKNPDEINFFERTLAGGSAGAIGIMIANPTDLIKIRMQADRAGTRYVNGVMGAFVSTFKAEGLTGLWQGVIPNMQRAYIVNAAELATYDQVKTIMTTNFGFSGDSVFCHLVSSMSAGVVAALCSQPVDLAKNRLMNQPAGPGITPMYTGMLDCMYKVTKNEGITALYKGIGANASRIGLWCVAMFMSYEQFRIALRKYHGCD